ncbi:MAG: hypothetical protein RL294_1130 [Actinomycetota bacterium]|jgi:hypothetical protein
MVDTTDPSTWVYDPRYDDVQKWYKADMKRLDPLLDGQIPDKPVGPVVTGSFAAWKRSMHTPNVGLIAHCQKFFVHDSAEARVDDDGQMHVTCTCGLVVPIAMSSGNDSPNPRRYWSIFFAENRPSATMAKQRVFFEHPGHRDPLEKTVLGGFLVRLRETGPKQKPFLELRCHTCGWLTPGESMSGKWTDFEKYAHRYPIDMHNLRCPQPETTFWDGDMYLWGHGPATAFKLRRDAKEREAEANARDDESRGDVSPQPE